MPVARGVDLAALFGINPNTGQPIPKQPQAPAPALTLPAQRVPASGLPPVASSVPQPAAPTAQVAQPAVTPAAAKPAAAAPAAPLALPAGFDENYYLSTNADVAQAVQQGIFKSGADHYQQSGQQEGRAFQTPYASSSQGGLPVNTVAAQTPWQKEALTGLAAPQTAGNDLMSLITKQLEQVGGYLKQSTTPMTAEGFQQGVNQYMDPYRQQVVDSTVGEISKEGERARARIMAANGGDDSSSTGVQLSELDRNIADAIAKATGSLSSEGFNNAANMTKGFYDTNTGNAGSAAQVSTALPAITSGVANTQRNNAIDDLKNKLFAGTAVQDQNQALLDAVTGKFSESQGFDLEMVQKLAELLGKTPTAGGGTSTNPYPNTAEKIGTTLQSSGIQDLLGQFLNSGNSGQQVYNTPAEVGPWKPEALPWL